MASLRIYADGETKVHIPDTKDGEPPMEHAVFIAAAGALWADPVGRRSIVEFAYEVLNAKVAKQQSEQLIVVPA